MIKIVDKKNLNDLVKFLKIFNKSILYISTIKAHQ
jgi:hypothetical protein